ncbi:MAG: GNAT family N-acetyltransferase [Chloroflexota bacterium]
MGSVAGQEQATWDPPILVGERVVLRRHRVEDLAHVQRWYGDPEVSRLTRYTVRPMDRAEVERYFRTRLLSAGSLAYGIHLRESERLIGLTTFSALDPENGSVLFHITIGEHDCWGQGYGTEATRLMLALAFERFGLNRVGLSVFDFNERAIRSYLKAGFTLEGRLREAIARDGRRWDELQRGILRHEWRARMADLPPVDG